MSIPTEQVTDLVICMDKGEVTDLVACIALGEVLSLIGFVVTFKTTEFH